MNIALSLSYVGTAYHGWQVQKNGASVQETVTQAINKLLGCDTYLSGVGRTDAGVHARRYVANFKADCRIPLDRLPLALGAQLPEDIAVNGAVRVPDDFDARFDCTKKEYAYYVYPSKMRDPFLTDRAYRYAYPLDPARMQAGAQYFVGKHDFNAVRSVGTETRTTVRTVHYFQVSRAGELIECRVCADGFLYNMVRAMTGTIVYAAEGNLSPEDIPAILASGNRTLAGPTVPPGGLYMTKLWYEEDVL